MLTYNRYCKYCGNICGTSTFNDNDPRDPSSSIFYDGWHNTCWETHVKPTIVSEPEEPGPLNYLRPAHGKVGDTIFIKLYPPYDVFFNGVKAIVVNSFNGGTNVVVPVGATTGMISIDNHFIDSDGYARAALPLQFFTVEV